VHGTKASSPVDARPANAEGEKDRKASEFPIGWDEGNTISQRYKLEKMPTSYVVDRKGIIRFVHGGYTEGEEEQIARQVDELLR